MRPRSNNHHILFHRKQQEATPDNYHLRCKALGLMALIDIDAHDDLHRAVPGVPPLDIYTAQRVRRLYVPTSNPLEGIENYMRAVEQAMSSPKTHTIERQVASLAIHAVDLQRPFIKGGLIRPDLRVVV